jgi:hypothetical protein
MTSAADLVRRAVDNAVSVPAPIEPLPRPELPRGRFLPIAACGLATAAGGESVMRYGIGEPLALYLDLNGCARSLAVYGGDDRRKIASLFAGEPWRLPRLWPAAAGKWNVEHAVSELLAAQAGIGVVAGHGFVLMPEGDDVLRAHIAVAGMAGRLLRRGVGPFQALDLAQGWNAGRGGGVLTEDIVAQIVDAACGRALAAEEWRRAG